METNTNEQLWDVVKENKQRQDEIGRLINRTFSQLRRNEKPRHDFSKLMKVSLDIARLQMQLLEKISKLPAPETPYVCHTPTREEWDLVKAAILRGEGPAWD